MKKLLLLMFFVATNSHAYSINSYKDTLAKFDKTQDQLLSLALGAYHTGIAESFQSLQKYQSGKIFYEGKPFICIPETAVIDAFMIESVMRNQVRNLEPFRRIFGEDYGEKTAFQLAFMGLWRTFPCPES